MAERLLLNNIFQNIKAGSLCESVTLRGFGMSWSSKLTSPKFSTNKFHTSAWWQGVTTINMPALSPTMTEGTIVKWLKKEGDSVSAGDVLCEIQTDKAVIALEVDKDGILAKVLVHENSADIKVGTLIALIVGEGENWKNVEVPKPVTKSEHIDDQAPTLEEVISSTSTKANKKVVSTRSTGLIGPAGRNLLAQFNLDPSRIPRNGPHGVLLKGDILNYTLRYQLKPVKQTSSHPAGHEISSAKSSKPKRKESASKFKDLKITSMRRAQRLLQSKESIAHSYSVEEVSVTNMMAVRKRMEVVGLKATINDFIVKSVSNALCKCPAVNVLWDGSELRRKGNIDISIVVASGFGLVTPIVTNVAEKDVIAISGDIKALVEEARLGKLQTTEFMGGSFTISNLGMFGVHHFSDIINPPQCAILAVGGSTMSLSQDGRPRATTGLTLSYDASCISEESAAKFLATLKYEIENVNEISMGIYSLQHRLESIEL